MASVNKVILVGRVGKDPECRSMPDGSGVANFSIATSSSWKDKSTGEKKEETEWHRLVAYGRTADVIRDYVQKGKEVYVEGRLKTRKYTDQSSVEKYITEIVIDTVQLLGGRSDKGQNDSGDYNDGANQGSSGQNNRSSNGYNSSNQSNGGGRGNGGGYSGSNQNRQGSNGNSGNGSGNSGYSNNRGSNQQSGGNNRQANNQQPVAAGGGYSDDIPFAGLTNRMIV